MTSIKSNVVDRFLPIECSYLKEINDNDIHLFYMSLLFISFIILY